MSIFSAASGGMHERKELRRGQRQQMAEAFAKFKASNPLATVADFQNFIVRHSVLTPVGAGKLQGNI